jgi:hypothetical protein
MNSPVQAWARTAGILILITFVAGGFGEGYAPDRLIADSGGAATLANLMAHPALYHWSFAAYLTEAFCDIGVAVLLYLLLKPVGRGLALATLMLGLFATAFYAACELFYFALPQVVLRHPDILAGFTTQQVNAVVQLSMYVFDYGGGFSLIFYGAGWMIRGWLMIRSGYLPKLLGGLMIAGGAGFVVHTLAQVLAPAYESGLLLLAMAPGGLLLGLWLLIRGVDAAKWEAAVAS